MVALRASHCQGCGMDDKTTYAIWGKIGLTTEGLSTHHLTPVMGGGRVADGVVTLCDNCHRAIHTVNGKYYTRHINQELTAHYRALLSDAPSDSSKP